MPLIPYYFRNIQKPPDTKIFRGKMEKIGHLLDNLYWEYKKYIYYKKIV